MLPMPTQGNNALRLVGDLVQRASEVREIRSAPCVSGALVFVLRGLPSAAQREGDPVRARSSTW
eukprot:4331393-Alexandrium_andersonii.AAC.1